MSNTITVKASYWYKGEGCPNLSEMCVGFYTTQSVAQIESWLMDRGHVVYMVEVVENTR
jgi:hypothetical protein